MSPLIQSHARRPERVILPDGRQATLTTELIVAGMVYYRAELRVGVACTLHDGDWLVPCAMPTPPGGWGGGVANVSINYGAKS